MWLTISCSGSTIKIPKEVQGTGGHSTRSERVLQHGRQWDQACTFKRVAQKLRAMTRVVSKFGAYSSHLATLSEDSSVKPADHTKLRGYYNKWTDTKCLLGCAFFINLLTPCMIYSKSMQSDEIDILGALMGLLKTLKETDKLASKPLDQWPTYSTTVKCTLEDDGSTVYQMQKLKRFDEGKAFFTTL